MAAGEAISQGHLQHCIVARATYSIHKVIVHGEQASVPVVDLRVRIRGGIVRLLPVLGFDIPTVATARKEDCVVCGVLNILHVTYFGLGKTVNRHRFAIKHGLDDAHGVVGCVFDGQNGRCMSSHGIWACIVS